MSGKSFWALRRKRTGTFEPTLYKSEAAAKAKADQMGMFDVVPLFSAAPVREEGGAVRAWMFRESPSERWHVTMDRQHVDEYLKAFSTAEVHPLAIAAREEAPERRECDDCGFKGTSDDASKEQDYCTACGGNSQAGGPDECAHCGAKNHMVMACPKCGGRFSLDEDAREEAPAPTCQRCGGEIAGWCCQNCPAEFRENDDGVLIFDDREAPEDAERVVVKTPCEHCLRQTSVTPESLASYRDTIGAQPQARPRGWDHKICTGCSASLSIEEISASGKVSCCPDRRMVTVRELVDAYEARTTTKAPLSPPPPPPSRG